MVESKVYQQYKYYLTDIDTLVSNIDKLDRQGPVLFSVSKITKNFLKNILHFTGHPEVLLDEEFHRIAALGGS